MLESFNKQSRKLFSEDTFDCEVHPTKMKLVSIFFGTALVLLKVIEFTYSASITNCFYIDKNPKLIEISCSKFRAVPEQECYSKMFNADSQTQNSFRSKVQLLKLSSDCNETSNLNKVFFETFTGLRDFDVSNLMINHLYPINLNLDKLFIAHNKLTKITASPFEHLQNVTELDFSFNQISLVESESFSGLNKLNTLNLSNNLIGTIDKNLFKNNQQLEVLRLENNPIHQLGLLGPLTSLKHLDLRNTELSTISLPHFLKLESIHLEDNPIKRVDCRVFSLLSNSAEAYISWENVRELDTSCMRDSLEIAIDTNGTINFHQQHIDSKLNYPLKHLQYLTFLNVSGNQLKNTPQLINYLGSSLETLDLSSNFVGKINSTTFKKFNNLQYLNLSNTNLSNFGFKTFYHQNKLKVLDLSNNNLKKVNFTLLWRSFKGLNILKLEGNELSEVNSITRLNFPRLFSLGISKNQFTCEYVHTFLRQWEDLQLLSNPSDDTHIDGVDCYHEDQETHILNKDVETTTISEPTEIPELQTTGETRSTEAVTLATTELTEPSEISSDSTSESDLSSTEVYNNNQSETIDNTTILELITESIFNAEKSFVLQNDHQNFHSAAATSSNSTMDLRIIERLLLVLCVVCCGYLMMKSKLAQGMKKKIKSFQLRRNVDIDTEEEGNNNSVILLENVFDTTT